MRKKKIFLICPVRYGDRITTKKDEEIQEKIRFYVEKLEKSGHKVLTMFFWPYTKNNERKEIKIKL